MHGVVVCPGDMLVFEAFISGGRSPGHNVNARKAAVETYRLLPGSTEVDS